MTADSDSPWVRVGAFLAEQRENLGYKRRASWARHVEKPGFRQRVITDLELGARDTFADETLRVAEDAYRLVPGSIRRAIASGGLPEPLPLDGEPEEPEQGPAVPTISVADHVLDTPIGQVTHQIMQDLNADADLSPEERAEMEAAVAERIRSDVTLFVHAKRAELERRRSRDDA